MRQEGRWQGTAIKRMTQLLKTGYDLKKKKHRANKQTTAKQNLLGPRWWKILLLVDLEPHQAH